MSNDMKGGGGVAHDGGGTVAHDGGGTGAAEGFVGDTSPTHTSYDNQIDEILNDVMPDEWGDQRILKKEAKSKLSHLVNEARREELWNILDYAREHTITDIEMIERRTGLDFIEAVKTEHISARLKELKRGSGDTYPPTPREAKKDIL